MGDDYTLLWLRSAEPSKGFSLRNLYYSKISAVMLLGYRTAGIARKSSLKEKTYALRPKAAYFNS